MMDGATVNRVRLAVLGLAFSSLLACGGAATPPEEALRAWVAEGRERAEEKDRRGLVGMISPAYHDARGNRRDDIENLFRVYFLRQHNIRLVTNIDDIRIFGDSAAELDLTVGMMASNDGVLGFGADAYAFEMELVREGEDWLLISGRWGEIGGDIH